jgi:hypothetical protein
MKSIRERRIWIAEHLETRLSVEDLADRMSMSVRSFELVLLEKLERLRPFTCLRRAWRRGGQPPKLITQGIVQLLSFPR